MRAAVMYGAGDVRVKDVAFVDIDPADPVQDRIDAAYSAKYRGYARSIIDHINAPGARDAVLKLIPR